MTYFPKPDLTVKFAPRVPQRMRKAVDAIALKYEMSMMEVMRYCLEAGSLLVTEGKLKLREPVGDEALNVMFTIRTSSLIRDQIRAIGHRHLHRYREVFQADIMRRLLDTTLPIAQSKGMAHIVKLREDALLKLRAKK